MSVAKCGVIHNPKKKNPKRVQLKYITIDISHQN
jgi:hypothetical protein